MAIPVLGRVAMPFLTRAGGLAVKGGRALVGRQVRTYTKKPQTWLDWVMVGVEGGQLGYAGYHLSSKSHPNKTDTMVAPYMMERRYP